MTFRNHKRCPKPRTPPGAEPWLDQWIDDVLPRELAAPVDQIDAHIREGRFQRSLSLLAGASSVLAGAEVAYEHYRAGYGHRVMYTPVALSGALAVAGIWGAFSQRAARTVLRWTSAVTLLDGLIGFGFHVRGVARKPGGWRLPVTNIVMGPPIFAPLLFGVSAYLGLVASFLRPEQARPGARAGAHASPRLLALSPAYAARHPWTVELREGRFQKHLAAATFVATFCSGVEALYSHYKGSFRHRAQWTPIVIAPLLIGSAAGAVVSPKVAKSWLPATAALAIAGGGAGVYFHVRGIRRRPGGFAKPLHNILYGPPVFAPLLFAACGVIGVLASLMRRER